MLYALIPVIGYNVDSSVTIPGVSQWNSTTNTNLPTGVSLWQTIGTLTKVVLIIAAIAVALFILVSRLGGLGGQDVV